MRALPQGLLTDEHSILVPYHRGRYVQLRIGIEDAFSVHAFAPNGKVLAVPEPYKKRLRSMIKLQHLETFTLEAVLAPDRISLLDLLCVNGVAQNKPYRERMAMLAGLLGDDTVLTQLKKTSSVNFIQPPVQKDGRWVLPTLTAGYAVKALQEGVRADRPITTHLVPQYFVFKVYPSKIHDRDSYRLQKEGRIKWSLGLLSPDRRQRLEVGTVITSEKDGRFEYVSAEGVTENGQLINPYPLENTLLAQRPLDDTIMAFKKPQQHIGY